MVQSKGGSMMSQLTGWTFNWGWGSNSSTRCKYCRCSMGVAGGEYTTACPCTARCPPLAGGVSVRGVAVLRHDVRLSLPSCRSPINSSSLCFRSTITASFSAIAVSCSARCSQLVLQFSLNLALLSSSCLVRLVTQSASSSLCCSCLVRAS